MASIPKATTEQLQVAVDQVYMYKSFKKAAAMSGIPKAVLGVRHAEGIKMGLTPSAAAQAYAAEVDAENIVPKTTDGTIEDVVEDVQRLYEINGKITEGDYAQYGLYAETVWKPTLITFDNLKKRAGVKEHRNEIRRRSQEASKFDNTVYAEFNNERINLLGTKYSRPLKGRHIHFLAGSDFHDRMCDPLYRRSFITTAKREKFPLIILGGDVCDMYSFSTHAKTPGWNTEEEFNASFDWMEKFFSDLRNAAPDAQIDYLEGNHEYRALRSEAEQPQETRWRMRRQGVTLSSLLHLDTYQINYIGKLDLSLAPSREAFKRHASQFNSKMYLGAFKADHYPTGQTGGLPGFSGHHHKHKVWDKRSDLLGPYEWHQLGCGHVLKSDYMSAANWTMGFLTGTVHTNHEYPRTSFQYHDLSSSAANILGNFIERTPEERVETDWFNKLKD